MGENVGWIEYNVCDIIKSIILDCQFIRERFTQFVYMWLDMNEWILLFEIELLNISLLVWIVFSMLNYKLSWYHDLLIYWFHTSSSSFAFSFSSSSLYLLVLHSLLFLLSWSSECWSHCLVRLSLALSPSFFVLLPGWHHFADFVLLSGPQWLHSVDWFDFEVGLSHFLSWPHDLLTDSNDKHNIVM